ncbi:MAG: hypothetical protein RSB67_03670 [Clostridia bacterium]
MSTKKTCTLFSSEDGFSVEVDKNLFKRFVSNLIENQIFDIDLAETLGAWLFTIFPSKKEVKAYSKFTLEKNLSIEKLIDTLANMATILDEQDIILLKPYEFFYFIGVPKEKIRNIYEDITS